MATPMEIEKEQADRLYELLLIKKDNKKKKNKALDRAIGRAEATMTKEAISWVVQKVEKFGN